MAINTHPSDGRNFKDLSGIDTSAYANPYDALLDSCEQSSSLIQARYSTHRETRNTQQKAKLLSPDFAGFSTDPILAKLLDPTNNPDYEDPRNCLVFWARPTQRVRRMIGEVQTRLTSRFPSLWLMPVENLHMTVMEMAHSKTWPEIQQMIEIMDPKIPDITNHTTTHHPTLVKPMISYDSAALALSFLPAASETYTYHHLRRDAYNLCQSIGVEVASRYVVPSSHLTIARFVNQDVFDQKKVNDLVDEIEMMNQELRGKYWEKEPLEWRIGEEQGLVCRKGTVWYGGGESHHEGRGI